MTFLLNPEILNANNNQIFAFTEKITMRENITDKLKTEKCILM